MSGLFRKFLLWLWPYIDRLYLHFGIMLLRPPITPQLERISKMAAQEIADRRGTPGGHAHSQSRESKVPGGHGLAILLAILLFAGIASAQSGGQTSAVPPLTGTGAPTGGCGVGALYVNTSTGDFYDCNNGAWLKVNGAGGMGCTLQGGTNLLLYDTSTACNDITKWQTNGTTTITALSTAIFDLSNAATFKPPQAAAPTVEGTSAFNTTTHLPVWGFNGASTTTIPTTLANASHKWLNSYTQSTGVFTQTQPACGDLSDSSGGCTMSTTAGGDLSGTLPSPTVAQIQGGVIPTSAAILGTNGSKQPIAATAHGLAAPVTCADSSGSGTVQVCNTSPSFTPASGDAILYSTTTTNSGDVTANVNSLGAKHIRKWSASATLASGDLLANTPVLLIYDGTYWEISVIGNAPAGGVGCTTGGSSGQILVDNGLGGCSSFTHLSAASVTETGDSSFKLDLTAGPTDGFKVPVVASATSGADGAIAYDSTNKNTHIRTNGADSIACGFASAPTTLDLVRVTVASSNVLCDDSSILAANVVTQTSNASSGQICTYTGANKVCVAATALPNGVTGTTQSTGDNSTKVATTAYVDTIPKKRALGWGFGDVATGSTLTTSEVGYVTVPFACTITGWHIMADAGTVTIKTARVNAGTALPTIGSNSISTSGVALSSGTKVDSTTVTDFTSTTIAANDTLGFFITAVATAKQITFQLDCTTV